MELTCTSAAGSAADPAALAKLLLAHAPEENGVVDATMAIKKEKQRLTLLQPARTISAVLEASKAADILMLCIPAYGGLDPLGEQLVDALSMQGVGTVVGVLQGAEALPLSRRGAARKQWSASLETRLQEVQSELETVRSRAVAFEVRVRARRSASTRHRPANHPSPRPPMHARSLGDARRRHRVLRP